MTKLIMKPDENRNAIPVLSIGSATDIINSTYVCMDEVLRIAAITESRVWYRTATKTGSGLFLPAGSSLDVSTKAGNVILFQKMEALKVLHLLSNRLSNA